MIENDKKENSQKELDKEVSKIIELSEGNNSLKFISSKLPMVQSLKVKSKIIEILTCILSKEIKYKLLTRQIFEGIPDDILSLRPLIWKICLNYLSLKPSEWSDILRTNRSLYDKIKKKYMKNLSNDITKVKNPLKNKEYYKDNELYSNIKKDVLRTKSNMNFLTKLYKNLETNAQIMNRILFIYAKKHQDVCYVQGMNDILAPIYYCFSIDNDPDNKNYVEADSYITFEKLMDIIKKIYTRKLDDEPDGVYFRLNEISTLLKIIDYELYLHLKRNQIKIEFYGFRWMTLFFTQDFEMPDILRIWDAIFGNNDIFEFLYLLILAAIILKKKEIMNEKMSGIMMIIQNLDDISSSDLINKAVEIRNDLNKKLIW